MNSLFPPGYLFFGGLFASLFLALVAGGITVFIYTNNNSHTPPSVATLFPTVLTLDPASIGAQSAIIYDPSNNRVLFAKNSTEQLPLASLTKLMTAEVVLEKKLPNTPVRITLDDLRPEGDWGFRVGDVVSLGDLLRFGLVASSNDAMAAAASTLGNGYLADMNLAAVNLGLTQTYFLNPTGLDLNQTTSGGYGSVYDLARLTALFYKKHPEFFERTIQPSVSIRVGGRTLTAKATFVPLSAIPGFIGAKTGYTDLAGGNLVVLFDAEIGHPLVAVVFGSTEKGRFNDIRKLITAVRNADAAHALP